MLLLLLGYILPGWAVFGILGTLWWYFIGFLIRHFYRKYGARARSMTTKSSGPTPKT
jgi:hypothetical protein